MVSNTGTITECTLFRRYLQKKYFLPCIQHRLSHSILQVRQTIAKQLSFIGASRKKIALCPAGTWDLIGTAGSGMAAVSAQGTDAKTTENFNLSARCAGSIKALHMVSMKQSFAFFKRDFASLMSGKIVYKGS